MQQRRRDVEKISPLTALRAVSFYNMSSELSPILFGDLFAALVATHLNRSGSKFLECILQNLIKNVPRSR